MRAAAGAGLILAYRGGFQNRPGWWLRFTYDESRIAELKRCVPASCRTWDELKGEWWVADEPDLLAAVERLWPTFAAFRSQVALPGFGE